VRHVAQLVPGDQEHVAGAAAVTVQADSFALARDGVAVRRLDMEHGPLEEAFRKLAEETP
jgi:hypothetical protein